MRNGSCGVQQGLSAEGASIVKAAVSLAKRRGHAQVTPLHVANTMLTASNGLLRGACLQSHSHPLQCKALELCFNVALNRLPAAASGPGPGPGLGPSISNALVAAFKRAQAHQRRGSVDNQPPPLLALKIEVEQLIISILDDPSVSRVMREAGFSSTQVKSNLQHLLSSSSSSSSSKHNINHPNQNIQTNPPPPNSNHSNSNSSLTHDDDVTTVLHHLMSNESTSTVIVGECVSTLEAVARGVMDKVERGDVDQITHLHFLPLSLSAFAHFSRPEVDNKIRELRDLATTTATHTHNNTKEAFVLYVGDLKWVFEYRGNRTCSTQAGRGFYCPVEHMIMEIGKLVSHGVNNGTRFWVMGIATFQTYMTCRNNGFPSLQTLWALHPFTLPAGSLALTLIPHSDVRNESTNKKAENGTTRWVLLEGREEDMQRDCLATESSARVESQDRSLPTTTTCNNDSSTSTLPAWLQQYKNETKGIASNGHHHQNCVPVGELCKKWNSMCSSSSIQNQSCASEKTLTFSSLSPSSSTSGFSYEHQHPHPSFHPNNTEPTLRMYINHTAKKQPLFPSSNPNSSSSSDVMETEEYVSKFKGFTSDNLKTLCDALERKVAWQKHIIPDIATTVLQCRSGMSRRKGNLSEMKQETWLFFQGVDMEAKEKIARELARLVFGSHRNLVCLSLSSFCSTRADSSEDSRNKRSRDDQSCTSYIERFADSVCSNPHRVFLVEDIEQADYRSQLGFKRAMERGSVQDSNGEEVRLSDAIIILSCETFTSTSRSTPCSPPPLNQKSSEDHDDDDDHHNNVHDQDSVSPNSLSLDLNISIHHTQDCDNDRSLHDIGLLQSVDRRVIFNFQEL